MNQVSLPGSSLSIILLLAYLPISFEVVCLWQIDSVLRRLILLKKTLHSAGLKTNAVVRLVNFVWQCDR